MTEKYQLRGEQEPRAGMEVEVNVLNGVLSPILVFFLFLVGNSRKVMRGQRLSWLTNCGLILTFLLMAAAAVLLFYGLLTGSGGR